jgi:DNA-binding NarL/FixJ family response regulator
MKLLIIDDHTLYVEGVKSILKNAFPNAELLTLDSVNNALETLSQNKDIDLILLDLRMPNGGGLSILSLLKQKKLPIPALVVSASEHFTDVKTVLENGAFGYLPKTASADEFITAIKTLLEGDTYVPNKWKNRLSNNSQNIVIDIGEKEISLSPRQYEVLQLIEKGYTSKEISAMLNLSLHTINDHVKSLFIRVGVNSRTELVQVAKQLSLFSFS